MHNLAVGNAHGSEAPGETTTLKGRTREAEGLQPFQGWGRGRGARYPSGVARRYVLRPFQGLDAACPDITQNQPIG